MKVTAIFSLVLAIPTGSLASYPEGLGLVRPPTYEDFVKVEELVNEYIVKSGCHEGSAFWNATLGDCDHFPEERNPMGLGSRLVRHAFHDATGFSDCYVDLMNPENNGLQSSQALIDMMYQPDQVLGDGVPILSVITKADFCAWAYISAVRWSRGNVPGQNYMPHFPIKYGRLTHEYDGTFPAEEFPNAAGGAAKATGGQIHDYFADKFGFTARETTVILGAHTFGGARRHTSGYAGMWTVKKNKFSNEFYENLVEPKTRGLNDASGVSCNELRPSEQTQEWRDACCNQDDTPGDRCMGWELVQMGAGPDGTKAFQWRHSCHNTGGCTMVMLHVDMALYRDIDDFINEDGSITEFPTGAPDYCVHPTEANPDSRIFASCFPVRQDFDAVMPNTVEEFEDDEHEDVFLDEFAEVFTKMIETVPDHVTLTELFQDAPTAAPTLAPNGSICPCFDYDATLHGNERVGCDLCKGQFCKNKPDDDGVREFICVKGNTP